MEPQTTPVPRLRLGVDKALNGRYDRVCQSNAPPDGEGISRHGRTSLHGSRYEWQVDDTPANRAWAKNIGATKLRA
jgi:hypothetical protein